MYNDKDKPERKKVEKKELRRLNNLRKEVESMPKMDVPRTENDKKNSRSCFSPSKRERKGQKEKKTRPVSDRFHDRVYELKFERVS